MHKFFEELNEQEISLFKKLDTPSKIQNYLSSEVAANFKNGKHATLMSPRRVIREGKAHCIEGALLAAAILWYHGEEPLLMDLRSSDYDYDHVVTLFKREGKWGAISKTNYAVLKYREPVYKDEHELAMSFFHEYFTDNGEKTLRAYSKPYDLRQYAKENWIISEDDLWHVSKDLDNSPHVSLLDKSEIFRLRKAEPVEVEAGQITQWKKSE